MAHVILPSRWGSRLLYKRPYPGPHSPSGEKIVSGVQTSSKVSGRLDDASAHSRYCCERPRPSRLICLMGCPSPKRRSTRTPTATCQRPPGACLPNRTFVRKQAPAALDASRTAQTDPKRSTPGATAGTLNYSRLRRRVASQNATTATTQGDDHHCSLRLG